MSDTPEPDADESCAHDEQLLFRDLGVVHIVKTLPTPSEIIIKPQNTPRFRPLPNPNDPQAAAGQQTLLLFQGHRLGDCRACHWQQLAKFDDRPREVAWVPHMVSIPSRGMAAAVADAVRCASFRQT